jgi:hypothetical protein
VRSLACTDGRLRAFQGMKSCHNPLTVQVEVDHGDECQEACVSPEQARDLTMRVSTAVSLKIMVNRNQPLIAELGNDGHGPPQLFLIADMQGAFHPIAG